MTPSKIADLASERFRISNQLDALKSELSAIDGQISTIAEPFMTAKLKNSKKDSGSLRLDIDGIQIQGDIRKTVKWDSDALREIAEQIAADDAAIIFKLDFSVSEKQLELLEECDHPALGQIMLARSVKLSPFSAKPIAK